MNAVTAEDLRKTYGETVALDGLSVSIDNGELFGFLGPNGAGKTTTIEVLTGVIKPDSGTAEVLGVDPIQSPMEVKQRIGVLPEKESPPSSHTPREYFLDFIAEARNLDKKKVETQVEQWAKRLGFVDQLDSLNSSLSRGQQQKVMLVGAFITEPEVLVIDEPLANLDPRVQAEVKKAITEFTEDGMTVLLSTHQIYAAEELCDRVAVIDAGKVCSTVRPDELSGSLEQHFIETVGDIEKQ